jgi:D-sedoheptulose 7-phosphate isomerase
MDAGRDPSGPDPMGSVARRGGRESGNAKQSATPTLDDEAIDALVGEVPELAPLLAPLREAAAAIVSSFDAGGTLFLTGNGGSLADCLHLAGELKKSFETARPLPPWLARALRDIPGGEQLAAHLQAGLPVVVLGADPVFATAVDNDIAMRHMQFAQELVALGKPGDVLLAISSSGRSRNVMNAALVASAMDMPVLLLTGDAPSPLSDLADVVVHAPASSTATVQSLHSRIYHALCRVIEKTLFPVDVPDTTIR